MRFRTRLIIIAAVACAVIAPAVWIAVDRFVLPPASEVQSAIGGPFELKTTGGKVLTHEDFAGKPYAVFFGFTHCPDVCPTTLAEMARWIDNLGDEAEAMRFAFITVDPERDTAEIMTDYVASFDVPIIPLTGTRAQIDRAIKTFRVYAQKVPLEDGDYTMNHSASVLLMDEDGNFADVISFKDDHDTAVAKLRELIDAG